MKIFLWSIFTIYHFTVKSLIFTILPVNLKADKSSTLPSIAKGHTHIVFYAMLTLLPYKNMSALKSSLLVNRERLGTSFLVNKFSSQQNFDLNVQITIWPSDPSLILSVLMSKCEFGLLTSRNCVATLHLDPKIKTCIEITLLNFGRKIRLKDIRSYIIKLCNKMFWPVYGELLIDCNIFFTQLSCD